MKRMQKWFEIIAGISQEERELYEQLRTVNIRQE